MDKACKTLTFWAIVGHLTIVDKFKTFLILVKFFEIDERWQSFGNVDNVDNFWTVHNFGTFAKNAYMYL